MKGRVRRCTDCRRRVSRTAGSIFQDTRTPLTVWFAAAWYMTSAKNGVSALQMQRLLGLGSYQTVWTMLHRFRTAMGRAGQDKLSGTVEVDETFVGGQHAGPGGRGALGKEIVIVAVELLEPKGFGRVRLAVIPKASTEVLREFLLANIEPGWAVVRPPGPRPAPRGAPRRRAAQALAAGHPPGLDDRRSSAGLPRRVHLPL